jgi:chorismate mutase
LLPSTRNCTLATPTLSEEFAEIVTVPETVALFAGAVIDTVGGVVSVVLLTVTVTFALVALFPAASLAIARTVCEPLLDVVVFQEIEYGAAVSRLPKSAPSSWNCTLATPTLSLAFATIDMVPLTVAPSAGAVMDTVGGVVSVVLLTFTGTGALVAVFPAASLATAARM